MENTSPIKKTISGIKEYVKLRTESVKLNAIAQSSKAMGEVLGYFIFGALGLLVTLFLGLALSFYLGEILNDIALGFLITGGVFFIALLVLITFKKPLLNNPLADFFVRKLLNHEE